ncbi:Ral GTPase-activating protein subunit alpha-1 [Mortierella sp. GBA43]|nr:Ral GTPase-activating protein subunit alpha-1 [Mortierella sp. GBA43]
MEGAKAKHLKTTTQTTERIISRISLKLDQSYIASDSDSPVLKSEHIEAIAARLRAARVMPQRLRRHAFRAWAMEISRILRVPPVAPLQTAPTSLATSAAARFSQAFSPLLAARRKSAVIIDLPSTPDTNRTFIYPISVPEGQRTASHSQEHLNTVGSSVTYQQPTGSYFESNFKMASFSSPLSSRSRKTQSGSQQLEEPLTHTGSTFHTGLTSHFGRDQHESGHREGKGSIAGSGIEKALKKAKVFLDERAKSKARATSLWAFLDASIEFDQAKFFREHAEQVFAVTQESFWHQVEKFKQRPDRNNGLQSKEVIAMQKTLLLVRLILLYLPERMKNGWHRQEIAKMLAQVLCYKNHPRIRIFGFRLLLLWLNDLTAEYSEAIYLFSNAISLDLFMYDGEDLTIEYASSSQTKLPLAGSGSTGRRTAKQVSQYFENAYVNVDQVLLQSDGAPICPNPLPPTFQDSLQLIQIFLGNIVRMAYVAAGSTPLPGELESINSHHPLDSIGDGIANGFGIDAGMAAARFMFDIIKKYYLVKLFPECARNLQLIKDEGKEFGYKTCPPTILRTIISFIIQYCLDSNDFNSPHSHTSPATPILKAIMYSSEVNREMIHEIVRQGLSLPPGHPQYKDIVRGAVHIIGVWCLSGEEERPVFLRSSTSRPQVPSSMSSVSLGSQDSASSQQQRSQHGAQQNSLHGSQQSSPGEPYSTANSFLQRYFRLLTNVFVESPIILYDLGSNSSSEALGSITSHPRLDTDALYQIYKDIIGLFRAILTRCQIELDSKSWEVLLGSLLEIQSKVMSLQEKLSAVMSAAFLDDLAMATIETVLCAHSRCPNVSDAQWIALRKTMIEDLRHPQLVAQWAEKSSRRANSVHYDLAKQNGTVSTTGGAPIYGPALLGNMGFMPSRDPGRDYHSATKADIGEHHDDEGSEPVGSLISALAEQLDAQDEKPLRTPSLSFHSPDSLRLDAITERLPSQYGVFTAPDFVNVSMKGRPSESVLSIWKNIVCAIGNPNDIQIPLVKTEVMLCLIDIWDQLNLARASQPPSAALIPPLYDFAPWFFEAAKSSSDGGVGLPNIYGAICRMMCRRYDQDFDPEYYHLFYSTVIRGLQLDDATIGHSILANSSRIFTLALPGSNVLVVPFLNAIRQMLLKDGQLRDGVNHFTRKHAIVMLCSVSMLFYDFGLQQHNLGSLDNNTVEHSDLSPHKPTFTRLVLDLTLAEASVKPLGKFWDTHSMLVQLCGVLVVNEWGSTLATSDISVESDLLLLVLDHLYWTEASIVESAVEVVTTLAGLYQDHEDNGWIILEMVLSHLLSALQEHLKLFQSEFRRGSMIGSFYRCLTEWLMVIPSSIFSETDLSRWVFDLIETGILIPDSFTESERKRSVQLAKQQHIQHLQQQYPSKPSKKRGPSFKFTGKAIHQHSRVISYAGPVFDPDVEQGIVKEAAEATLIHLVHFMSNAPLYYDQDGSPVTMGMDTPAFSRTSQNIKQSAMNSPSSQNCGRESQKVFALNDSILISFEELPSSGSTSQHQRTRVVIRDETGRYTWDSEIFYREMLQEEEMGRPQSARRSGSRWSERFGSNPRRRKKELASQLVWRDGVKIREDEGLRPRTNTLDASAADSSPQLESSPLEMDALLWDVGSTGCDGDMLDQLLQYIGDKHPDCLFDGKTPLNQLNNGMSLSTDSGLTTNQTGNVAANGSHRKSTIDFELNRHVQEENDYTRISDPQARAWYDKLVELRLRLLQTDDEDEDEDVDGVNKIYGSSTPRRESSIPTQEHQHQQQSRHDNSAGSEPLKSDISNRSQHHYWRRSQLENVPEAGEGTPPAGPLVGRDEILRQRSSWMNNLHDRSRTESHRESSNGLRKEDAVNMAKAFQLVLPPETERPLDCYQHTRLLLSHLGLLYFDRFQEHNFVLLSKSAYLDREIMTLDKKSGRETFKIALLYIAAGQEGEHIILRNSSGSPAYNRFVQDLGWEVDLADHGGYIGGLERNGSNGHTAIYYCSSTCEVIFHEVVRMPTDQDDDKQLKKKRHVGNDHVHIVWSEHSRAYDRYTLGGDFGNVVIVLTPLMDPRKDENGQHPFHQHLPSVHDKTPNDFDSCLVSVEVIRDTNLPVFGPLVDGMVVPMSQLGRLVRQTVIHAARIAAAPPPLPPTPSSATMAGSASGPAIGANTVSGTIGSASMTSLVTVPGTGTVTTGGTGGQLSHRTSGYLNSQQQSSPSTVNLSTQSHQQHPLSISTVHTSSSTAPFSAGPLSSVIGTGSGLTNGFGTTGSIGSTMVSSTVPYSTQTVTTMAPGTAAIGTSAIMGQLLPGGANLGHIGGSSNAASMVSLVSTSGSIHGGVSGINTSTGGPTQHAASVGPSYGAGSVATNGIVSTPTLSSMANVNSQQQQQSHLYQHQPQASGMTPSISTGSTVSLGFAASVAALTRNTHPFKQRATTIQGIVKRHKADKWTYQQFMEQVFGYSHTSYQQPYRT